MYAAIFSPYATVAPHFETELEIAQHHYDNGDTVDFVACMGGLDNCDFNHNRTESACADCIGRRRHGLTLLSQATRPIPISSHPANRPAAVPTFASIDELKSHTVDNFEIGYAVLSSLVSHCRDPEPDLVEHAGLIDKLYRSAMKCYQFTLRYIEHKSPDRIYVFNGRFAAMRAVFRACQRAGVECYLHERGCDLFHYDFYKNHLPHDIDAIHNEIQSQWKGADQDTREQTAATWFHDRVNRVERNWHSFVKDQQVGRLPDGFDDSKHNIAIYCSSDDEFVAIGDAWQNRLYGTQFDGIAKIIESLGGDDSVHVYLRMHPNLAATENRVKQAMLALRSDNLTTIAPTDPCDTYHLMRRCDVTLTFGSSVGIEAVYWDKPSILCGPSLYRHLSGPYKPSSHEEVIQLLTDRELVATDKSDALKYGHWFQTHGIPFKYFEAESLFHGKFKGQVVYSQPKRRSLPRLLRFRAGKFIRALVNKPEDRAA